MRRGLLFMVSVALLLTVPLATAQAPSLTKADREELVKYLKETRDNVEKATKGLSAEQLNFKAAPERWSVAECLEHIAASEDYLRGLITDKVMAGPAPTAPFDATKSHEVDAKIKTMITDRSQKAQAPDPLRPTNRFGSPAESWKHFAESREKTIEYAEKENSLREHTLDSPVQKEMDAYQWLLFLSAHSARHTAQINEVKADPNFPKK